MGKVTSKYDGLDRLFIGGEWRPGSSEERSPDTNPFDGEILTTFTLAGTEDVDAAYAAAAAAQPAWASTGPGAREALMLRAVEVIDARHEELVEWLIAESGSTRLKAEIELSAVRAVTLEAASFPYRASGEIVASDVPGKENRVYRSPLGVVAVISPWNFPMILTQRSVAPALALGNAVVVKPASETPITGGLLHAKIFEEAGLPEGVLSVIAGRGTVIGDYVVAHQVPKLISFTGSSEVGRRIGAIAMGGAHIKRVSLELGGNSPLVVLDDADLEQAVNAAIVGRFLHQGEICMSTNRVVVDAKMYDEFLDRFVPRVKALKCGNPNEPDTVIGPIINQDQIHALLEQIEVARADGARELLSGEPNGLVMPPHIFADVTTDMKIAQQEIFGPMVTVFKANGDEDAQRIANATEYGLSSAVFSSNERRALNFALGVEAGMTHINDITVSDSAYNPFGGEKNSGIGRFNAEWVIEELTRDHWITIQHTPKRYPF